MQYQTILKSRRTNAKTLPFLMSDFVCMQISLLKNEAHSLEGLFFTKWYFNECKDRYIYIERDHSKLF